MIEKAYLVAAILNSQSEIEIKEQINELRLLIKTAGAKTVAISTQSRRIPDPATFIGKGKLEIIKKQSEELRCTLIVFNDEISPSQIKNIQNIIGNNIKVIDRTGLILDIFTKNARTKEAKTQVELAQLEYFLPRLTRQWTHLERQMGGVGTRAGAGETQIEVDRRLIRNKIGKLKKELIKIKKQRETQNNKRNLAYRIALIGYTNAGKSTLMNILTNSEVYVQDQLFATLDTTTRKLDINSGIPTIISDTVGFIRNLPHNLVASFRSTLNEIKDVDLLLKVFDCSSNNIQAHINTVDNVLSQLGLPENDFIIIMNKIDSIGDKKVLYGLKSRFPDAIFISSIENININSLIERINKIISNSFCKYTFELDFNNSKFIDEIYKSTKVIKEVSDYNGIKIYIEGKKNNIHSIKNKIKN